MKLLLLRRNKYIINYLTSSAISTMSQTIVKKINALEANKKIYDFIIQNLTTEVLR